MAADPKPISCLEFQAQLPEMITLGEDPWIHPHVRTCELCRALVVDLEAIADAARRLFPGNEPPVN